MTSCSLSVTGDLHSLLQESVSAHKSGKPQLQPHAFLVAWHGVLTLALRSWPSMFVHVKEQLNNQIFANQKSEAFGSKWPKITLAALKDDAPAIDQKTLGKLMTLCEAWQGRLHALKPIEVNTLSVVSFASRSLTNIFMRVDVPCSEPEYNNTKDASNNQDLQHVDPIVLEVLNESLDLEAYAKRVTAPGHRISHYKQFWTENTLVAMIEGNEHVLKLIEEFKASVESILPGHYEWMPSEAFHITLRSLDSR